MKAQTLGKRERLVWLDILRLLCALMILGFHWLRACFKVQLFGSQTAANLVVGYQGQSLGLKMLPSVLIAGTGHSPAVWLTNVIGLFGEFGWEGVSALIIISGFSLTVALNGKSLQALEWVAWLKKRAVRVLIPFYLVALPFLITYLALLSATSHFHGSFAKSLDVKLHSVLQTPLIGVVLSHTLLFDPFARQWQPSFFAPAWWFIPAILLAYCLYPFLLEGIRRFKAVPVLALCAVVTMVSYYLANRHVLINESWYFIVLQESFNLALGVVIGRAWLAPSSRQRIEKILFADRFAMLAFLFFVAGNVANWLPTTRLFASMFYGPGLVVVLAALAKRLERTRVARVATSVDAYDLYLVHQPFAFPVALAAKTALHAYGVFFGWFAFVAVASLGTAVLGFVQRQIMRRERSGSKQPSTVTSA